MGDQQLYSSLSVHSKKMKTKFWPNEKGGLQDLIDKKTDYFTQKDLLGAYVNSLKQVLEEDAPRLIVKGLFKIESNLESLGEKILEREQEFSKVPMLENFHAEFSRLVLQTLWEDDKDFEYDNKKIVEVLRISIENEIQYWSEQ